jgi:hypothetical protein
VEELEKVRKATAPLERVRLATETLADYQEAIHELGQSTTCEAKA